MKRLYLLLFPLILLCSEHTTLAIQNSPFLKQEPVSEFSVTRDVVFPVGLGVVFGAITAVIVRKTITTTSDSPEIACLKIFLINVLGGLSSQVLGTVLTQFSGVASLVNFTTYMTAYISCVFS